MTINFYKVRKWAGLIIGPCLTVLFFYIGTVFWGFLYGIAFFGVGLLLSAFIGNMFIKTPFSEMLEGKGILAVNLDSTGLMNFFVVGLNNPYLRGKYNGQWIKDIFDRDSVFSIAEPKKVKEAANITKDKKLKIEIDMDEYNKARFAFMHYPVLIWNDQVKSLLTKDFFSTGEKDAFAEHGVLYLNKQVEELTVVLRNFGRYVVDQLRPSGGILANKWLWVMIILGIGIVVLAVLFGPAILAQVKGVGSTATSAVTGAKTGSIIPK